MQRLCQGRKPCWGWVLAGLLGLLAPAVRAGETIDLAGRWRVRLDPGDVGAVEHWEARPLEAAPAISLPGTTDQAELGSPLDRATMRHATAFPYTRFPGVEEPARADARGFLVRRWLHLGPAWYERDIEVPDSWQDRVLRLRLERVMWRSEAWMDGRRAGESDSLATGHVFDLGRLAPGRHRLTVRVDNRMIHNLSTITHAYGPETQSRWNGLVGRLEVEAVPSVALRRLEVHPGADRRSVRVVAVVANATGASVPVQLGLEVCREPERAALGRADLRGTALPGESLHEGVVMLREAAGAWDEFSPVLHRVRGVLEAGAGARSEVGTTFGFRALVREGRELRINGRRLFLRGTLDCAVYPRTGHPPMGVGEWDRILRVVREHGFNHVRFHTWCPPEAAFEAADRLGLYLAPEVSAWVDDWTRDTFSRPAGMGRDPGVNAFVRAEARRIVEAYGNHPSFVLLCFGNEFGMEGTDWEEVERWVGEARARDPRRWYVATTARRALPGDDAWVTHAVHGKAARGVGGAGTDWDFSAAVAGTPLPVVAHETGQRPVFPDYADLLPKLRGPLMPDNYLRLRDRLRESGLAGQAKAFERASALFQLVQYRAEHEAFRRTPGMAGYQLLMLNDFTGQSEALVGILDPFWESKGVVRPEEVRRWNAPTVLLARFAKRTWSGSEELRFQLEIAHHGPADLEAATGEWELVGRRGKRWQTGVLGPVKVPTGGVVVLTNVVAGLSGVDRPTELTLRVRMGGVENAWNHWVYPEAVDPLVEGVRVTPRFDAAAERALTEGGTVLVLAHGLTNAFAARTGFLSVYWSAGWWGNAFSSLGILCDPRHPALRDFPNRGHSDWQWRELAEGATTFRLAGAPAGFRPVVQLVPDFHEPGLLAQVVEARVGRGRLLVCGYDLERDLGRRPAARQFRRSLLRHAATPGYRPREEVDLERARAWFGTGNDPGQGPGPGQGSGGG